MTKSAWKKKIKEACDRVSTYNPAFDATIDALAGILAKRDEVQAQLEEQEDPYVVEHTQMNGHQKKLVNPLMVIWEDLQKLALAYWKDLGLTPFGLRKLHDQRFNTKEPGSNPLLDILKNKKEC